MGRSITAAAEVDLHEIGAVVDMAGIDDEVHYSGKAVYMANNKWVAASKLAQAIRDRLAATRFDFVALTHSPTVATTQMLQAMTPPASNTTVTAFPMLAPGGSQMYALVVGAGGYDVYPIGREHGLTSNDGGSHLMTSDGTTLFNWTAKKGDATKFELQTSTDGKTWTNQTLTGMPAFGQANSLPIGPRGGQSPFTSGCGDVFGSAGNNNQAIFWAGARHILLGAGASNYIATRSSNGLAWDGDSSVAVLGSASVPLNYAGWWYRNGLNAFFAVGSAARYSTDGGVTWANVTGYVASGVWNHRFRINGTDPARLCVQLSGGQIQVSTNNGQTWTTRTMPLTTVSSLAYRGSTIIISDGTTAYKSTDDGANWTMITGIVGFAGAVVSVHGDAYRFYLVGDSMQICTSTDASTWTVRNIDGQKATSALMTHCFALDANRIMLMRMAADNTHNYVLVTKDGGVTWRWMCRGSDPNGLQLQGGCVVPRGTETMFVGGGPLSANGGATAAKMLVQPEDIDGMGAAFRASSSAVSAIRGGSVIPMIRVW